MGWKIDKGDTPKQPKGSFGATITLSQRWTVDLQTLANELIKEVIERAPLARPNYMQRFYLKMDWSKYGMAGVLLRADPNCHDSLKAETTEQATGICKFDGPDNTLRLRPLALSLVPAQIPKWMHTQPQVKVAMGNGPLENLTGTCLDKNLHGSRIVVASESLWND